MINCTIHMSLLVTLRLSVINGNWGKNMLSILAKNTDEIVSFFCCNTDSYKYTSSSTVL